VTGYLAGFEPAMREALAQAGASGEDVPVGAVVLDATGQIIARRARHLAPG
jgi:tRNA(Arg) A34 adenosine deaminase TadA